MKASLRSWLFSTNRMAIEPSWIASAIVRACVSDQALERELDEELGIRATIGARVTRVRHNYRHGGAVDLQFFAVHEFAGEIEARIYQQVRWVRLEDLSDYEFLAADHGLIRDLAAGKLL